MEWLWFAQFDWQTILLRRWLLQLGGLVFSLVVVGICIAWQHFWLNHKGQDDSEGGFIRLSGWHYCLVLVACCALVVGDLVLLSRLAWLACFKPFVLGHWWAEPFNSLWAVLIPVTTVFLSTSIMLGTARISRTVQFIGSAFFSISIARGWGLWSLALAIPQSGINEPLLGADVSFGLGRFPALYFGLPLLLSQLILTAGVAVFVKLSKPETLSDFSFQGFSARQSHLIRPLVTLILVILSAIIWLSRHQLL